MKRIRAIRMISTTNKMPIYQINVKANNITENAKAISRFEKKNLNDNPRHFLKDTL